MALNPLVVHIGSVDEIAGMALVGIHDAMRLGFIGIAAKDVAT